jgi:outer membrane biosynthesis protein TonB
MSEKKPEEKPVEKKKVARKPRQTKAIVPKAETGLFNMQTLMASAIEKGAEGIEILERLVALREKIEAEEARKEYFAALAQFQRDCPVIPKSKEVWNINKATGAKTTLRYRYAPIEIIVEHIKEPLARNQLSYTFETEQTPGEVSVTFIGHHIRGHKETTEITVPIMISDFMNKAQAVLSAVTYASRRAMTNGLGIATADEDDDGQATGPAKAEPQPPEEPPTKVEDTPKEKKERDVTPPPEPKVEPPKEDRKYTIPQLKGHCTTGVSFLEKNGAIDAAQAESILKGIDELVANNKYEELKDLYHQLRQMYDDWQKGKRNGK